MSLASPTDKPRNGRSTNRNVRSRWTNSAAMSDNYAAFASSVWEVAPVLKSKIMCSRHPAKQNT